MEKAKDLQPSTLRLSWDGEMLELKFNNRAMALAEDVYENVYFKQPCNWTAILSDLIKGKAGAVMAVYYGALKVKKPELTWDEFDDKFRLSDIPEVSEVLAGAINQALPDAEPGEGTGKNA